mgnify:CR=1 FL=1
MKVPVIVRDTLSSLQQTAFIRAVDMTGKIINFEEKYMEKLQKEVEEEAEIIFDGEGGMEGAAFVAELKDVKGVRIFLAFDKEDGDDDDDG